MRGWAAPVARRIAAATVTAVAAAALAAASAPGAPGPPRPPRAPKAPRPLEPARLVKAAEGAFDETFALDAAARRMAVVRGDGATFAKLELVDLGTGAVTASLALPGPVAALARLHLLPGDEGVVMVAEQAPGQLTATVVDRAGHATASVGPAAAFGFPPEGGKLIALEQRPGAGASPTTTLTLTPFGLPALTPAGKPAVYVTGADGEVLLPASPALRGVRVSGFFDGYARAHAERVGAPSRAAVLDTLTGKVTDGAQIDDALAWATAMVMRAEHPDRAWFAALNQEGAGVDIVDPMGKRQPATLSAPFGLYDPKSLRDQEGPEPASLHFSLALDPLNAEAVERRKPDLPMLDLYAVDVTRGRTKLRARVFTPRPVAWRVAKDRLVVMKLRRGKPARGGDEIQIYELH